MQQTLEPDTARERIPAERVVHQRSGASPLAQVHVDTFSLPVVPLLLGSEGAIPLCVEQLDRGHRALLLHVQLRDPISLLELTRLALGWRHC